MIYFHLSSVVLVMAAAWLGLSAWDAYDEWDLANRNVQNIERELETLKARKAELLKASESPVPVAAKALSTYFSRMLEAGEVLGAGVRIEARQAASLQTPLVFEAPTGPEVGLQVCRTKLHAQFEGADVFPIVAMLEDELKDLPITVTSISAKQSGGDLALAFDVDVFGRNP